MVKISRRKKKTTSDQILDESLPIQHDDSRVSSVSTTIHTGGSDPVLIIGDQEIEEDLQQSSVWKYATKIGSEKAKCNICQTGEYD
jgi:hypothetical protein